MSLLVIQDVLLCGVINDVFLFLTSLLEVGECYAMSSHPLELPHHRLKVMESANHRQTSKVTAKIFLLYQVIISRILL